MSGVNLDNEVVARLDKQLEAIRSIDVTRIIPQEERHRHNITQVGKGSVLRFEGKTYMVRGVDEYQETDEAYRKKYGKPWQEFVLYCLDDGSTLYLEWEEDDVVEVYISDKEVSLSALRNGKGRAVVPDGLDDLVSYEGSLHLDGTEYSYEDDYPALYKRVDKGEEFKVYIYEFEKGTASLSVEEWADDTGRDREEFNAWLSRKVRPESFEILVSAR